MKKNHQELKQIIESKYPSFTASHKTIAKYLLSNEDKFLFNTAYSLSEKIGVSESSIVRFAKAVGFDSYSEMQKFMQREYMRNTPTSVRLNETHNKPENILEHSIKTDISYMLKLLNPSFYKDFIQAADMIANARRVVVGGSRGSASLAANFAYNLQYLKADVILLASDSGDWQNSFFDCLPGDLLVTITMPKYSRRTGNMIRFAKEQQLQILTITDSKIAPPAEFSDCVLACEIGLEKFIWSSAVVISTLNALLLQIASKKDPDIQERIKKLDQLTAHYAPYEINRPQ